MWASKQKQQVFGLKTQFISSKWTLQNFVLGFKHFPQTHTAANIRNLLDGYLLETFELTPDKVYKTNLISI